MVRPLPSQPLFAYRCNLTAVDMAYVIDKSKDLTLDSWLPADVSEAILSDDGLVQVIQADLQGEYGTRVFLRLNVQK